MTLEDCLPPELRGATITKVAAGLSGAGVYRVQQGEDAYILKVAAAGEPVERWRSRVYLHALASDAGLAPQIVHVDPERGAVLSELVVDRGFLAGLATRRDAVIDELGRTLGKVHALPLPPGAPAPDPRGYLAQLDAALAGAALPAFVRDAIAAARAAEPPPSERPDVLSHNDVNPSNLVHDGARLLLLDWDTAGPNDPFYDLAAAAVFLRFDDAACLRLLGAHDGAPVDALPPRFSYDRKLVAVLCGAAFLHLAHQRGFAGPHEAMPLEAFYARLRAGELSVGAAEGQWSFGLALVNSSL